MGNSYELVFITMNEQIPKTSKLIFEHNFSLGLQQTLSKIGKAFFRAIPHKERTAKMSGKRYNKEVKKQLTMSLISDELGQASTKKKEFLGIMSWSEWVGIVQPHYI